MMDLDEFKIINDTFGHDIGDDVLRQIANTLKKTLRTSDFLARYGGDEMTLVLSDTELSQACIVTQKIQDQLLNLSIQLPGGQVTRLSVSGGIVVYPSHADTLRACFAPRMRPYIEPRNMRAGIFCRSPIGLENFKAPKTIILKNKSFIWKYIFETPFDFPAIIHPRRTSLCPVKLSSS